jgi:uncharacterized protein
MVAVTVDSFDVALGELRDQRGSRRVVRHGLVAEALIADVDSRVPAGAEALVDVVLEAFDGGVAVSGKVSACWEGECRRCLCPLDGDLKTEVKEIFRRGGGSEEGTYPMGVESLNLREMVLDALFAALPLLPLCREDCRGICPRCGEELNLNPCDCAPVEIDPRWSGLDALRTGMEALGVELGPEEGHFEPH